MTAAQVILSVSGLRKTFGQVRAVDDISFDVHAGEIFGLLGPNGAGKTTTIRMVLDILRPDSGDITFDGRRFSSRIQNIIGYLPEERGLYRKGTVLDTILYFAELRGLPRHQARGDAYKWLQRFGLLDAQGQKIEELSKGNQQKIQFIVSVVHDPRLVVLDEPFSGLDPVNQIIFREAMMDLKRRGKAVIFSTHQMDHAERLSDRICLIDHGSVILSGSLRDVKRSHGRNTIRVEFEGDGRFMDTLPGAGRVLRDENIAEIELGPGATVQEMIRRINDTVDIRRVELVEPSLHSIFLHMVGGMEAIVSDGEAG